VEEFTCTSDKTVVRILLASTEGGNPVPQRPMAGVRVLEVAQFTFAPAAGAVLADWGASVIKVEHASTGDGQRGHTWGWNGQSEGAFHPIMEHSNRGKRSIGLDIATEGGQEVLRKLVAANDVFLTNFLPHARARLGIEVEDIRRTNPDIIYVRASAHGNRGPEAGSGGYDSTAFWARTGPAMGTTPPGSARVVSQPAPAFGDSIGGMTLAGGIAAALFARQATGEPSTVDVSLLGVGVWAMGLGIDISLLTGSTKPVPPLDEKAMPAPNNPLAGDFRTADERWLNLTMMQPGRYWADFCVHINRPDLVTDERFDSTEKLMANARQAAAIIEEEIVKHPLAHWMERFKTVEGQWSPFLDTVDVGRDEQSRSNGYILPVVDRDGAPRELVASPVQFDDTPPSLVRAPDFAEHTDEILLELGYEYDRVIELKVAGAVT
jgi:crotonobetainyl-CoA:carnitine CoA-transferase CaiB-like acyl-CoA transferase